MSGLSNALTQVRTVISSSLSGWTESKHRNASLSESPTAGSDKQYNVLVGSRLNEFAASSNLTDTNCSIVVELMRNFSGGSMISHDRDSLIADIEDKAFTVSERLQTPSNYDYSNTGIIIINDTGESDIEYSLEERRIIWKQVFEVRIRRTSRKAGV